jgi:hypothetical protein
VDKHEHAEREEEHKGTDEEACVQVQIARYEVKAFLHLVLFPSVQRSSIS